MQEDSKDPLAKYRVDLLCGGFPCQPVSYSGVRNGLEDERWLWPEFFRIICLLRPRFALIENVPGILSLGGSYILRDLASIGYDAEWNTLSACRFGAPHTRDRVFIMAYSTGILGKIGMGNGALHWKEISEISNRSSIRNWQLEPFTGIRGMAYGVPNRMDRLKGLGNAVIPGIVELIGERIQAMAMLRGAEG